ncbi:MAG: carbohydrate-binding family V/XII [Woeseiaceae bacterium]
MKRLQAGFLAALLFSAPAAAIDWPQEVAADEGTIVVYQPQPESLEGNVLKGRAAMSLELNGRDDPIFGAFWFAAKIDNDTDAGVATIRDLTVTKVRWPESRDADEQRFTAIVEGAVPATGFEISTENLSASLATADVVQQSLENLKTDPPVIQFTEELAVLLLYDGEPRYAEIENSPYERVLNTSFAVIRKKNDRQHWLSSGNFWYSASSAMGPWSPNNSPPADLEKMLAEAMEDTAGADKPPAIYTADKPTELIVTIGKPDWQSLPGGELLYVQNTETAWLRELATNNMYLLLSGRWYRSKSQDGPWTFVRSDELPKSFASIPPESDIGGLRVSVAGTDEANDAMLDAQIPETAAIERSKASIDVEYDGKAKFEKISGTEVSYATNTASQVLLVDGKFYAVDAGVWFMANNADGPWSVADSIPDDKIQEIPPSSPVYNTTHVHIYESTPEVVYVGYTPGYMWSYPYYGVPVYGTGWYYPPYYGRYYYPRPPTWGLSVGYNPWTGWNFGLSWSNGFFSVGVRWGGGYGGGYYPGRCCGGYYGGGYHGGYHGGNTIINTGDINIGNNVNIGNRNNIKNNFDRDANRDLGNARQNVYNRDSNRSRNADRATAQRDLKQARPASNRQNNVYADRDGNVARRSNDKWESRDNGQWKEDRSIPNNASRENRDRANNAANNRSRDRSANNRGSLDRANHSRQRGATRQASRPASTRQAPARRRR